MGRFQEVDYIPGALELIKHFYIQRIPQAVASSSRRHTFELKTSRRGIRQRFSTSLSTFSSHQMTLKLNVENHILILSLLLLDGLRTFQLR
jgi:hypothetical protein